MIIIALTFTKFKQYEDLLNDDLVAQALKELRVNRKKVTEYKIKYDPIRKCEVCGFRNMIHTFNAAYCNDCGWRTTYKVPYKGKASISRNLNSIIRQIFGRKIGNEVAKEKINLTDLESIPVDLNKFDTGEYTREQVLYLNDRFEELLNIEHVEFTDKDKATIHFLILQELKVKNLYRLEALTKTKKLDKDFTKIKKSELSLYHDLKEKVDEIINEQKKSDKEMSLYDKIANEMNNKNLDDLINEYQEDIQEVNKQIEESTNRRQEIKSGVYSVEEEIEEIEKELDQ